MAWDFQTDPDFQRGLDWIDDFVRDEIEALDHFIAHPNDFKDPIRQALIPPLQQKVRERGLGRARCGPVTFGCQAPDSGNNEMLAHYGTPQQKAQFLEPLLRNDIVSCFSMTEPQGGADPKVFTTSATQDGDEWVIKGEKWFSSNARHASCITGAANPGKHRGFQ